MTMISPFLKIVIRPVARAIDALLEKLFNQISEGKREDALKTVIELRAALTELRKYLE